MAPCGIFEDVRTFDEQLARYLNIVEIHLWAGFPRIDLSSVNFYGRGLDGPSSSLFFEVLRILNLLKQKAGSHVVVKSLLENVASMREEEQFKIDRALNLFPYFLEPADAVPMRRPRLCWCSEPLEDCMNGVQTWEEARWTRVQACAPYPQVEDWITPGHYWPGGSSGAVLPTCMKAIVKSKPPPAPAGSSRCDAATKQRYEADEYRYPPYQYGPQFVFYSSSGQWRLVSSSEKELLMGFGMGHTSVCYSASRIKQSTQKYDDERNSLLGDS